MLLDFLTFSLFFLSVSLFSTIVDIIYQHVADITTLYWKVVFVFLLILLPLLFKAKSDPLCFKNIVEAHAGLLSRF